MTTDDNACPSAEERRNDAVHCRDEARPIEIGDGEWASSELSYLASVPRKPL
jgi:hypothetical protein